MGEPKRAISRPEHVGVAMRMVCRLKAIMRDRGLAATQLSKRSGVSRETIGGLCNNTFSRVRRDIICKICAALGITSFDDLFELYEADILFPIRLHKEVTFHVGSDSLMGKTDTRLEKGHARMSMGAWDFRAMKEIHEHLNRTVPEIKVHVEEHVRYDPAVAAKVTRTFECGNHIVFGSPIANQFAEEVVCHAHHVPPYSPEKRTAFPFAFHWDTRRSVQSSFGFQGTARRFGIVSTRTGQILASHTRVATGHGNDAAMIMAYRVFRPPKHRQYGRVDENIVIAILGYSGIGTYGGARVVTDPVSSRELYPDRTGVPLTRVVAIGYTRPPDPSPHDNRQVTTAQLVSQD